MQYNNIALASEGFGSPNGCKKAFSEKCAKGDKK
jgi:hypothetical protein